VSDFRSNSPQAPSPCDLALPEGSFAALVRDMQTPLAAIGNAAFLLTIARDDVAAEKMLNLINRQVAYLSSIADMLAELARGTPESPVMPGLSCAL
jgi:signal transduction histidine kinase